MHSIYTLHFLHPHNPLEGLPKNQSKTRLLQLSNFAHVTHEVFTEHRVKGIK